MSLDTSLVIAKIGDQYFAAVLQAAESFYNPDQEIRWDAAQAFIAVSPEMPEFSSLEEALEHGRELEQKEIFEYGGIEYPGPFIYEIDLDVRDVRDIS